MADNLEDDFIFDDLVAVSDKDEFESLHSLDSISDTEGEQPKASSSKLQTHQVLQEQASKKRKRREKAKERKKRKLESTLSVAESASIASQDPVQLADYLTSLQAKSFTNYSQLELDDLRIQGEWIEDTSTWSSPRTLDILPDFISKVVPILRTRLQQRSKHPGAPTLLFITGAALRVVDITRVLKSKQLRGDKGGEVAKLFARHFKVEDHVAYLQRSRVGAAVGTPGRIGKLLELDALSVSALTHIILDLTHQDVKKRNILDIPETRDEVFRSVLGAPKVRERLRQGKTFIVLF